MYTLFILTRLELKRLIRHQMVWIMTLIAVFILFLMDAFNYFTIEEQIKMIKDFSLGIMNLLCLVMVVYEPMVMVHDEWKEKTGYALLTAPLSRTQFILGKALALAVILGWTLLLNFLSLALILTLKKAPVDGQLLMAVLMIYLKNLSLMSFSFLLAVLPLSPLLASLCSLFIYLVGSVKSYFLATLDHEGTAPFAHKLLFSFFPNFRIFDVVESITLGNAVPLSHVLNCFLHFLGISVLIFGITGLIFNKKEI